MSEKPKPTAGEQELTLEQANSMWREKFPCLSDKPTTGEVWIGGNCKFCNEPDGNHKPNCRRPTAGEWTEGKVFAYFESEDFKGLAEAINAALAAERGRENTERGAVIFAEANAKTIQQLREQLAGHIKAANEVTDENIELERQLATAVEALKVIEIGHGVDSRTARAALAKIGGK